MQRKTEKLFRIFKRISMGPHTIDELYRWTKAQEMHLSKRTLYRYLEEIECFLSDGRHEIEVKTNAYNQKVWQVIDRQQEQEVILPSKNQHDIIAEKLIPESVIKTLRSFEKDEPTTPVSDKLLMRSGFRESRLDRRRETVLVEINDALRRSRYLRIRFTPRFSEAHQIPRESLCGPYSLIFHDGGFYLALRSPKNATTLFAPLECMESAKVKEEVFKNDLLPSELNSRMSRCFGLGSGPRRTYDVELMLHSSPSEYSPYTDSDVIAQKKWHPEQQVIKGSNGDCIIRMRTYITRDLLLWIAGFGDQVVIRSPEKLRTGFCKMIEKMGENNGH